MKKKSLKIKKFDIITQDQGMIRPFNSFSHEADLKVKNSH